MVTVGAVPGLGPVIVDGHGHTLYVFAPDQHSGTSRCNGPCAVLWPPLVLPKGTAKPAAGAGISPSELGTTTRSNGSVQVTYAGWPLYLWSPDTSPGVAHGQGLDDEGGLWYVISPSGDVIT